MIAFAAAAPRSKSALTVERYKTAGALFGDFLADEYDDGLTVDHLSLDLLGAFYDWLDASARRSLDTKHRYVENVRRMWAWLYDTEWHPLVPRPKKLEMARDVAGAVHAPTFEEMARCVRNCVSEGPRRLTTILYATGVRTSQAERMTGEQIDLVRGTLSLPAHKGLPGRVIPLAPWFIDTLRAWGLERGELVTRWDVADQTVRTRLNEAWARAGVRSEVWEGKPGTAFRAGLTSGLKQLGADKETAELYVGRGVEGARKHYLDLGTVPFEAIAKLIPPIEAGTIVKMKAKAKAKGGAR